MATSQANYSDVLIIGGGLSGLAAAYKIQNKVNQIEITLFESSTKLGGQLYSSVMGEIGARWITEDQYHIYNLLRELLVDTYKRNDINNELKRSWDIDSGIFSGLQNYEINKFIREIDQKSWQYRPGSYKLDKKARKMEKFICSRLFFEKSRQFIRIFVQLICGIDSKNITMTEFFIACCSCGGLARLISLYTGSSNSLIEFSSRELIQELERKLNTVRVLKRTKIVQILHYSDYVTVYDDNGQAYHGSCLIIAVPWNSVKYIKIVPPIPSELRNPSFENQCFSTSFIAMYTKSYWEKAGFSGSFISFNPTMIGYEYKPLLYAGIVLHDDDGFELISRPIILNKLAEAFGVEMKIPFIFEQRTFEQNLLLNLPQTTPWNRVIWASSCSATSYRGCLGGAVQSGYRAAVHALLILRPQVINWQDLSEIQQANIIRPKKKWMDSKFSSWNLYDFIWVGFLGTGIVCLAKYGSVMRNFVGI